MCLRMTRKKSRRNSLFFDNYKKLFSFRLSIRNVFEKISKKIFVEREKSVFQESIKEIFFRQKTCSFKRA